MGFNFAVGFSFLFSLVYVDYFKNSDISSYFCGASVIWVTGAATCADPDLKCQALMHLCAHSRFTTGSHIDAKVTNTVEQIVQALSVCHTLAFHGMQDNCESPSGSHQSIPQND